MPSIAAMPRFGVAAYLLAVRPALSDLPLGGVLYRRLASVGLQCFLGFEKPVKNVLQAYSSSALFP
jgi:hypothetical protein